ncbi:BTB/POZ domain-containing protein [Nymphaea thermarum]|nr:BTB/POZ domain-containing protein [Nymphaea thermarum]
MNNPGPRKKQRVGSSSRLSSYAADADHQKPPSETDPSGDPRASLLRSVPYGFNDPLTTDVVLHLLHLVDPLLPSTSLPDPLDPHLSALASPAEDPLPFSSSSSSGASSAADKVKVFLHSSVLHRSKYFSALLSDRWKGSETRAEGDDRHFLMTLQVSSSRSVESYLTVLQLFYSDDFSTTIVSAGVALSLLPVALELLFDDCIKACLRFLEAVPWTEEEEKAVLNLLPLLPKEDSQELAARLVPTRVDSSEDMLHGLILAAVHSLPNIATVKAFVAKLLRDHSSRDSVGRVLQSAFMTSLRSVKESLEEYSSPNVRGDHEEIEALQRLNLHTAVVNARHLLWLVERMIELRVADSAVKEWSEQQTFSADLQRAFRDDAWKNIAPGLPALILRCTCRMANAVAAGSILVDRQVRMRLVKDWLPVLLVCREHVSPIPSSQKSLYQELEEKFLQIISTLPMSESQELLQQCLSFSTRNVDECPHLVSAFNTWFRRARRGSLDQLHGN